MSRYTWIFAKPAGNVADMIYVLYSMVLSFNQNLKKQSRSLTITSKIEALIRLSLILTTHFDFDFSTVQPSLFWTSSFKSDLTFRPKGRGPKSRKLGTCSLSLSCHPVRNSTWNTTKSGRADVQSSSLCHHITPRIWPPVRNLTQLGVHVQLTTPVVYSMGIYFPIRSILPRAWPGTSLCWSRLGKSSRMVPWRSIFLIRTALGLFAKVMRNTQAAWSSLATERKGEFLTIAGMSILYRYSTLENLLHLYIAFAWMLGK